MAHAGESQYESANGVVRTRRPACRRGDDHAGPVPVARRVVVYHAPDCSLCARAIEVVRGVQDQVPFDLELTDIGGVDELEARYRELLPVVEIDGEVAFTYFVDAEALRDRLRPVPPTGVEGG